MSYGNNLFANMNKSQLTPTETAMHFNNEGHKKYMQVDFDKAIELYNEALKYDDNAAIVYYNRGTIRYRMGYFNEALQDLEKSIKLDPTNKEFQLGFNACMKECENSQIT